jgi:hypothetical protein
LAHRPVAVIQRGGQRRQRLAATAPAQRQGRFAADRSRRIDQTLLQGGCCRRIAQIAQRLGRTLTHRGIAIDQPRHVLGRLAVKRIQRFRRVRLRRGLFRGTGQITCPGDRQQHEPESPRCDRSAGTRDEKVQHGHHVFGTRR